ncbi:hypothetical protein Pcinc_037455 [Petrolisthes cinctipes]|uniref:Uncharacterized protein n=1 Tax=Petrolisthes cinctipes TaxID=88211 RepID=A0AAE1BVQ3_PETCI|nr:hypothetical protein Pcinc_037455 [Petrolisthes cinctipes]
MCVSWAGVGGRLDRCVQSWTGVGGASLLTCSPHQHPNFSPQASFFNKTKFIPNLFSTIPAKIPPLSCPSCLTPVPTTVTHALSYTTPVQPILSPDTRPGILVKVNKIRITS